MNIVCQTCGGTGSRDCMVTCNICREISEHVFCMRKILRPFPEVWRCDGCSETLSEDGNVQLTNWSTVGDHAETKTSHGKEIVMSYESSAQTAVRKKKLFEMKKLLSAKYGFSMLPDFHEEESVSVTSSPRSICNSFVPNEHVAVFPSELISRTSDIESDTLMLAKGNDFLYDTTHTHHPSIKRNSPEKLITSISRLSRSKNLGVKANPGKRSINLDTPLSPSKFLVVPKSINNGKEASPELHREEIVEGSSHEKLCHFDIKMDIEVQEYMKEECREANLIGDFDDSLKKISPNTSVNAVDSELLDTHGYKPFAKLYEECPPKIGIRKVSAFDMTSGYCCDSTAAGLLRIKGSGIAQPFMLLADLNPSFPGGLTSAICWEGTFHIDVTKFNGCFGVQAHLPHQVSDKAVDITKTMDANLKFNVLPRIKIWPTAFQIDPVDHQDVALYFLPSKHERSKENYMHLVKYINANDFSLLSQVGNIELMIFSSEQMSTDNESKEMYLWGIFRKVRRKNVCHIEPNVPAATISFSNQRNNSIEKKFNSVTDKLTQASAEDGNNFCKKPKLEDIDEVFPDVPPGFSRLPATLHQTNNKATDIGQVPKEVHADATIKLPRRSPRLNPTHNCLRSREGK